MGMNMYIFEFLKEESNSVSRSVSNTIHNADSDISGSVILKVE